VYVLGLCIRMTHVKHELIPLTKSSRKSAHALFCAVDKVTCSECCGSAFGSDEDDVIDDVSASAWCT
jgi:hypothetical protein